MIDSLCKLLQQKLTLGPDETDLVLMQHSLVARWKDGSRDRFILSLVERGVVGGDTAMARTVGITAAAAAHLVLNGVYCAQKSADVSDPWIGTITRKGSFAPMTPDVYMPMLDVLKSEGIVLKERMERL